jgi:hypothetical protein
MAEKHCLIPESLHARDIAPPPLPADDASEGFAGGIEFGEGVQTHVAGLTDAAILAGKREAAKQVRPDFQPVKPRLSLGRNDLHQFGGFRLMRCEHGSMLPAPAILRQGGRS